MLTTKTRDSDSVKRNVRQLKLAREPDHSHQGFDSGRGLRNSQWQDPKRGCGRGACMTKRVLLIEDEANIIQAISYILSRDG